jgi:hypothetical protein
MAATFFSGTGSPNGVVFADPGDAYLDLTGGPPTLWVKQSGVGTNTGWIGLASGGLIQTLASDLAVDTVIPGGGGFALIPGLAPIGINIGAGHALLIHFTVSGLNNAAGVQSSFRLRVDGATVKGATFSRGGGGAAGESAAIVAKVTGLGAGAHTVQIEANSVGGPTNINAGSQPDQEHATLLVEEVSV